MLREIHALRFEHSKPPGKVATLRFDRIDETMLYVHVAEAHARELPDHIREAAQRELDPDRRIVAMLGARGKTVAKPKSTETKLSGISAA